MAKEKQYAQYKGRTYEMKWQGTRPGNSEVVTKLCFLDGSKEFWATTGEPVTPCKAPSASVVLRAAGPKMPKSDRRSRKPCGYPGCTGKNYCDECSD